VTLAKLQTPASSDPVTTAKVPLPHAAPQPKEGAAPVEQQRPTSIAGLIGNLFGGSKTEPAAAAPPPPQKEQVAARSTDLAAKPKQPSPAHTVSAPVRTASAGSAPWPREATPKTPAEAAPPPTSAPVRQEAAKAEPPRAEPQRPAQPEIRTAYSTPPASNNGLLSGAQPVVPAGTFSSFR
jgi:hypothetical protein